MQVLEVSKSSIRLHKWGVTFLLTRLPETIITVKEIANCSVVCYFAFLKMELCDVLVEGGRYVVDRDISVAVGADECYLL